MSNRVSTASKLSWWEMFEADSCSAESRFEKQTRTDVSLSRNLD